MGWVIGCRDVISASSRTECRRWFEPPVSLGVADPVQQKRLVDGLIVVAEDVLLGGLRPSGRDSRGPRRVRANRGHAPVSRRARATADRGQADQHRQPGGHFGRCRSQIRLTDSTVRDLSDGGRGPEPLRCGTRPARQERKLGNGPPMHVHAGLPEPGGPRQSPLPSPRSSLPRSSTSNDGKDRMGIRYRRQWSGA